MSEIYKVFDNSGLTALTNHMKVTRTKANSNEAAIETLGEDLAGLSEEVVTALGNKQDKLTFDSTPTSGSTNPVTSGGVKTYADNNFAAKTHEHSEYLTEQVQSDLSQTDSAQVDYVKGVIRQESLPEGYPYKEGSKTVIEWDGNADGRPSFGNEVSGACKVSDEVFDNLAGCPITFIAGDEVVELTLSEGVKAMDNIYSYGDGANQNSVLVVLGENAQNLETGTYFFKGSMSGNIMYVSKLTVSTETIHPMSEEYLPDHTHDEYQTKLTFDTAPKYNSTNPVTSGGVYTALLDKQNKITGTSGQFVGFNAAGFPTAKDLTLPTGFARCAGTYDSSTNRYTVTLPDAMDSIPTGYAFILIPDADNAAEDVDITANYKTAGGQFQSSIVELRFRNSPENEDTSSVVPSGAIKQNVPLMVVKGAVYWFIDSIHYHLFDSGITTAGDGAAYTATVSGIESLEAGISFIMIPHTASTSQTATLNVNGLGAKQLRRPLSSNNTTTVANSVTNWMYAGKPVRVMYNGTFWIVMDMPRPHATDLYGTVPVANGGVPSCTADNNGQFLRVVEGVPTWATIANAEGSSY